jgi:hypothetical protein
VTGEGFAEPIIVRWGSATSIEKLILPSATNRDEAVKKLAAGPQLASFGFQGHDVIDETYRKASKLDTSAISTNFCPYETEMIDVIGQALWPKLPSSSQGIRAELYKLNVSLTHAAKTSHTKHQLSDLPRSLWHVQGSCRHPTLRPIDWLVRGLPAMSTRGQPVGCASSRPLHHVRLVRTDHRHHQVGCLLQ